MEPEAKRHRVAAKTRDEILVENNARNKLRRLPPVDKPAKFEQYLQWFHKHYTVKALVDDARRQRTHWDAQPNLPSQRTFLHIDNTPTSRYNNLQTGVARATPLTAEDQERVRLLQSEKQSATMIARDLGQRNYLESAAIFAFENLLKSVQHSIQFERMPDPMTVDICATLGSHVAPIQVKTSRALPGTQATLNVSASDGRPGGRYENHILLCIIIDSDTEDNCTDFDKLPLVQIKEMYIMDSSDVQRCLHPTVYDHALESKRGRRPNSYEKFRYVVGRDNLQRLEQLTRSLEDNIKKIGIKKQWTRDMCFFKTGTGTPNTGVSITQETELRGLNAVNDALKPFKARAPWRQNETVDIMFYDDTRSVRVSLKTASFNNYKKETKEYSGFTFDLMKAPKSHHCDIVIALQFDVETRRQVVAAIVFSAEDVYKHVKKNVRGRFYWSKFAHQEATFDLTDHDGRQAFKDYVASFMILDKERTDVNTS